MILPVEQVEREHEFLLTIGAPFYNSAHKSGRLITTVLELCTPDVEVICVDDGSIDQTFRNLQQFERDSKVSVVVLHQNNRGPGGARNAGLTHARGEYVWFVDSDDNICLEVLEILRGIRGDGDDFIDFNFTVGLRNAMALPSGPHSFADGDRAELISNFGSLVTKIFNPRFIKDLGFEYPEYCYYEDNQLAFILAMKTNHIFRIDRELYAVNVEFESATRGAIGPRFFDRLTTAAEGAAQALPLASNSNERAAIIERFQTLFLRNTSRQIFRSLRPHEGVIAALQERNLSLALRRTAVLLSPIRRTKRVIMCARVMRQYRTVAASLAIEAPLVFARGGLRLRVFSRFSWLLGCTLRSQEAYFAAMHRAAWPSAGTDRGDSHIG